MDNLLKNVSQYVGDNIGNFHKARLDGLNKLDLSKVLKRKNPYLFKAKYALTAEEIVRGLVDAHISSQEETIFGNWLEKLAIFVNRQVYQGRKSGIPGIDLEFEQEERKYIVSIKSGPNWGNSSQIKKMIGDFNTAKRTLRQDDPDMHIVSVNGCCYGREERPDKKDYFKYCGQKFWAFISGNENLYVDIVEPIGYQAKEKNEYFMEMYSRIINKFTGEFARSFCHENGAILWNRLVEFNSSVSRPKRNVRVVSSEDLRDR